MLKQMPVDVKMTLEKLDCQVFCVFFNSILLSLLLKRENRLSHEGLNLGTIGFHANLFLQEIQNCSSVAWIKELDRDCCLTKGPADGILAQVLA